ncbi:MAG: hypothetical protein EBR30_12305 [Cytophagia bacterium]|jgi:hypothetical protein|nr:hypothetical protein [Cytophagia bacterium]
MNLGILDNVLIDPNRYIKEINENEFIDVVDGDKVFHNIQPRSNVDMFARIAMAYLGPKFYVTFNFVRKSPLNQQEPNFIHTDEMMGDVTAILYLSKDHPQDDGTTIYDENGDKSCVFYSKFNRMVLFDSTLPHSRNIFENFGEGDDSRLIQVAFLKSQP